MFYFTRVCSKYDVIWDYMYRFYHVDDSMITNNIERCDLVDDNIYI